MLIVLNVPLEFFLYVDTDAGAAMRGRETAQTGTTEITVASWLARRTAGVQAAAAAAASSPTEGPGAAEGEEAEGGPGGG